MEKYGDIMDLKDNLFIIVTNNFVASYKILKTIYRGSYSLNLINLFKHKRIFDFTFSSLCFNSLQMALNINP